MSRPLLVLADGPNGPLPDPALVASLAGLDEVEVILGWVVRAPAWLATTPMPVTTLLTGIGTRAAVGAGRVRPLAPRLSAIPSLMAGRLRPDVAVVAAHQDGPEWRFAHSPGFAPAAARFASAVIVERWPGPPRPGSLPVEGNVIDVLDRADPPDPPPDNRPGPEHQRIGELVPDGATIQWGPGVIGASVVAGLGAPVRVRSGLVTDELVALAERDLLVGDAETAYVWGGAALAEMAARGRLALRGVAQIHDLSRISAIERSVAINTALQVGLDGAVNVERVGGRVVAGPGGHPDFCAGASRSPGGVSIVALVSTAGGRSTIVARPDVVSTPRSDVDVVVTEHGVADLRHLDDRERAARLIAVAAPEHRDALRAAAASPD
jgi:acyl CoA:acetate/3-ketoacid CoA transferase beta subunit